MGKQSEYGPGTPKSPPVIFTLYLLIHFMPAVLTSLAIHFVGPGEQVMDKIKFVAEQGVGLLFIGVPFFHVFFIMLAALLGHYRWVTKCNAPDQQVYRVFGGPADKSH